jgi:hypothetical protein
MAKARHRRRSREAATAPKASPRMERAWRLFEEGDKLLARREAKAILGDSPGAADAEQARELLSRTEIPRVALIAAAAAATLILLLILLAIART